tara:strand:- start:1303 stop:1494 length:192 start_codon:yes stop_codon:yes gene_type:complete
MKPEFLKTEFPFLIDPMFENIYLTNNNCKTLTLYLIKNMEINKLNKITNIIHSYNMFTYEDED